MSVLSRVMRWDPWWEPLWWPVRARLIGLQHLAQGHRILWRANVELWVGCFGDIACETCDLGIWCRHSTCLMRIAQWLCGRRGHGEIAFDSEGRGYCTTCCGDARTA